ncbi:MAG: phosphonate metabolism transcriptional regulator PhnF [Pseudomonadota bacterium]
MTQRRTNWNDLHRTLRDAIAEGRLKPGQSLPTQAELCAKHGLSRHAVRLALAALEREGLLESWQGKGVFVKTARLAYEIGPATRFSSNMQAAGIAPGLKFLRAMRRPADAEAARLLALAPGEPLLTAELVRLADEAPVVLARHSVRASRFPNFGGDVSETHSITKALARGGVQNFRRANTVIEARLGTQQEAACLGITPTQPVLISTGVNVDAEERPVELSVAISRGDRLAFCLATQ